MTIPVRYSCPPCWLLDVVVQVPERKPGEDVAAWMRQTIEHLGADHAGRSPWCHPEKLTDVKVPLSKRPGAGIGEP